MGIVQHCELTMVAAQYSCKVARLETKDGCPLGPGANLNRTFTMKPLAQMCSHERGLALDASLSKVSVRRNQWPVSSAYEMKQFRCHSKTTVATGFEDWNLSTLLRNHDTKLFVPSSSKLSFTVDLLDQWFSTEVPRDSVRGAASYQFYWLLGLF